MEIANKFARCLFTLVLVLFVFGEAIAGPQVDMVVGPEATELERFAATELAGQFKQLFEADVKISEKVPAQSTHLVLIGTNATNPAIAALGGQLPKLSDQGHMLHYVDTGKQQALVVGGGSPVSTLWAVYELGQRLGIRYMLFGDLYPITKPQLNFEKFDVVLEPTLKLRTWRTINDFPIGPESWGLAEQVQVLKQLAKLKYNRVMLAVYPWQPFVDFEFNGIKKQTGVLWYGYRYPVDGDTAGRAAFRGAKLFENPDFAGKNSYAERVAAGTELARGIITAAGKLGMSTALAFSPLEFPREFAPALQGAKTLIGLEPLTIGPGGTQATDDPTLLALFKTQIRAYLTTYPEIDAQ